LLTGLAHIHEAIAAPLLLGLVERLWDEAVETLPATPGLDIGAYRAQLLRRFQNPSLAHRLDQIAQDGSRKLPPRLLAPLAERTRRGRASPAMLFALAAWLRCVEQGEVAGRPIRLVDPDLERLGTALRQGADGFNAMIEAGMLDEPAWVSPVLRGALADQRSRLAALGALAALTEGEGR
jgi:fructuronate reductase